MRTKRSRKSTKPLGRKGMKSIKGGSGQQGSSISGRITGIAVDPNNPNIPVSLSLKP